jgi:uncharacterized protein YraI
LRADRVAVHNTFDTSAIRGITMNHRTKFAFGVGLPAAALALALPAIAGPAAALTGDYATNGVYIRSGPHTTDTALGLGYPGQKASISCYAYGTTVSGDSLWDRNRNLATNVSGYSADAYLTWSGDLPPC